MKDAYIEEYRKFGLNVVYYRKKLRLTQLQLAELLDIQRSHISVIELGNVGVSFDLILEINNAFLRHKNTTATIISNCTRLYLTKSFFSFPLSCLRLRT